MFDQPVFSSLIPFLDDGDTYNLLQNTSYRSNEARVDLKHYWVVNNLNHLYSKAGVRLLNQGYGSNDYQRLADGVINDFEESGFNNDLDFQLVDAYMGLEYKVKKGGLILKPSFAYHHYHWQVHQYKQEQVKTHKGVLLPAFMARYQFNSAENLTFNYNLQSSFSNAPDFASRLRLTHFNQLFRGNETLENELSHALSLRYCQFNMYRGLFLHGNLSYTRRESAVRRSSMLEGIDQINTLIFTQTPEESYGAAASLAKQIRRLKFTLSGNATILSYERLVNNQPMEYNSQNYSYTLKAETRFKELPNIELGLQQAFNHFESTSMRNDFTQTSPYGVLKYDFLNDFILEADYEYTNYRNQQSGATNHFQHGNISLFYNKEDSPWSFEINGKNLFDVRYKNSNSFNEFWVSDQRIFIQPRMVLFKIGYKL